MRESSEKSTKLYRIPVDGDRQRVWLVAIGRKDFDPPLNAAICSVHFIRGKGV